METEKKKTPVYDFTSPDGITHRTWVISDDSVIKELEEAFAAIPSTYIADGHHRCASAVKVGLKRRKEHPGYTGDEEFNRFLSVLFPDDQLYIMPYNRVVKDLAGMTKEAFLEAVRNAGFMVSYLGKTPFAPEEKGTFGMYLIDGWYRLAADKRLLVEDPVEGLDVSVLQNNLLGPVLQIADPRTDHRIDFVGGIRDKDGNPVVGATVVIHGTTQGVATDVDGKYSLMTRPDDVLTISFIGYKTEVVPVKENKHLNVILSPASEDLEEVTVVAFGQQKKESVVSAITTVRPMDLKSSNSDLTSSFAGKIAGMVGWQTGGLPAALTEDEMNTKFYIRGITSFQTGANVDPLILLDGVESSKLDLARIAPEDIETFSVMKDASATAMYGARGANGVILVTTKKGQEGSVYATARYETVFSMPHRATTVPNPGVPSCEP